MSDEVPFTAINSRFLQVFKENPDARELVFYGGSGSSKSTSVAQILLKQFLDTKQPPVRMLFSRKWLSALKNTLLVDCIRILQAWGAYDRIEHNKNESFMLFGKNRIDFLGLDNPEKIKGAEYTHIWLEEATDFDLEDVRQLRLRLGRNKANENARYIFTFNPIRRTALDLDRSGAGSRSPGASSASRRTGTTSATSRRTDGSQTSLLSPSRTRTITASTRSANPASCRTSFTTNYRVADYPGPVSGLRRHRLRLQQRDRPSPASNSSRTACRSGRSSTSPA